MCPPIKAHSSGRHIGLPPYSKIAIYVEFAVIVFYAFACADLCVRANSNAGRAATQGRP